MIPAVFHRIWVGGPEPAWLAGYADTWAAHHPGWELRRWDDTSVGGEFPLDNQDVYDRAEEIAGPRAGQLRADVLRYELLWRYGGVYIDADFECLAACDDLWADARLFAARQDTHTIANGLMGAEAGHPFVRALIDGLADSVRNQPGEAPRHLSGPYYLTRLWRYHVTGWDDLRLLDPDDVFPYGYADIADHAPGETFAGYRAVHHWHNRRRERGLLPS